jgi:hypothetical protein
MLLLRSANVTYDELLSRYKGIPSPFDDQIAKDLRRTLPQHARYVCVYGLAPNRAMLTYLSLYIGTSRRRRGVRWSGCCGPTLCGTRRLGIARG